MAEYSVNAGGTISGGTIKLYTMPAWSVPSGQQFKRFKITISGADRNYTGWGLRNDSIHIGFNTWSTDTTNLHWTNGGQAQIWVYSSTTRSCMLVLTFETETITTYTITTAVSGGHGTLTANKSTAAAGTQITLTPTPNTGYELKQYTTSPSTSISSNKFTMPAANITITAQFQLKSFAITKKASPTGGGTVTTKISGTSVTSGKMGQTVAVSQTPNTGYYFSSWTTNPANLISNNSFTMPAKAVTVQANYLKRSTATVNKTTLTGGGTVNLTINPDKTTYSHKYKLSFGTDMETELTDVAAGTTTVTIDVPDTWSEEIPEDESKTGGTLTVYTYNGTTQIGSYQITGLTYSVPEEAVPEIGTITASVARTIGSTTYANVGDYYVQSHCGVEVVTDAEGALGSTVESMSVSIGGYSGSSYTDTAADDEIDFTSGLLTLPGQTVITVTATDSRGRTGTKTETITVNQYAPPTGSITVQRVNSGGTEDDMGEYGTFTITKGCTSIGSNSVTAAITSQSSTETVSTLTGNLLPTTRQTFSTQQEYTITLALTDAFETTTLTVKLPTAKFVFHIDSGGDRIALMKAVTHSVPSGKESTVEFSEDSQIYIGNTTLEQYIIDMMSSMVISSAQQALIRSNIGAIDSSALPVLYFDDGTVETSELQAYGFMASSGTTLMMLYIPLEKKIPTGKTVACSVLKMAVRGVNGYVDVFTYNNRETNIIGATGYEETCVVTGDNKLAIQLVKSAGYTNATINTPIEAYIYNLTISIS